MPDDSVESPKPEGLEKVADAEEAHGDIEMTDEQAMSPKSSNQELKLSEKSSSILSKKPAKSKSLKPGEDPHMLDGLDLYDLVKKNNGQDVDIEFYFDGKRLPQNMCFYEIFQLI